MRQWGKRPAPSNRNLTANLRHELALQAARIFCEEHLTDYRTAKQKAVQRLGLNAQTELPDNGTVQAAVLEYLHLFGGPAYTARLLRLRRVAVQAMKPLKEFQPRLVGAIISGAVTNAHHVQLHAFSEKAESLELFLHNRGIRCQQADRGYTYPDGSQSTIPLTCFTIDGTGVDVAVFELCELQKAPLNPADGRIFKRLNLAAAEALACEALC